jgi:(R,R)-butanediol dehydrogenase/meso-butanediol dehydrogenase/diacetyl reductase
MKAAVFNELGENLAVEERNEPVAGPGEAVLRVEACGVCGSDLHATSEGVFLQQPGTVLGHEFSGEVVSSGDDSIAVGIRATAVPVNPCGKCRDCREGYAMMCIHNEITGFSLNWPGAYAQFVKVPAKYVVPLADNVSYEEGAMVEPLAVGLHAVTKADIQISDRVLIIGAGPIGLSVTAFASIAGAGSVIVSERAPARLKASKEFGASAVIDDSGTNDIGGAFANLAGGPPDVIFDCVGVPGIIQNCIDLVRPRGKIVVVGVCMQEDTQTPISAIFKEATIQYVLGYQDTDFTRVADALRAGMVNPVPMVTNRVTFSQLPDAFEALRHPDSQIKVMLTPNT